MKKLLSFTEMGRRLVAPCSEYASFMLPGNGQTSNNYPLYIITPHVPKYVENSNNRSLIEINNAWREIQAGNTEKQLDAWRIIWKYGEEIIPGIRVFRLKNSEIQRYFYLKHQIGEI